MTRNDPLEAVMRILGMPTSAPKPELPTEPGLYVVRVASGDEWAAEVWSLSPDGFWGPLGDAVHYLSDDEVRERIGARPLERLIRHGEADL
jgi:hypothetical protein